MNGIINEFKTYLFRAKMRGDARYKAILESTFMVPRGLLIQKKGSPLSGYGFYDKPLLVCYSRSGTNWIRYIIEFLTQKSTPGFPRLFEPGDYVIDRAHEGFKLMNKYKKILLLVRNYKECLPRHLNKWWDNSRDVEKFLEDESPMQPAIWYIKNISAFNSYTGDKLLIYYEDLLKNPKDVIKKMVNFLELPKDNLNDLLDNIDYHIDRSVKCYKFNQRSYTGGSRKKIEYHSKKIPKEKRVEFDRYYQKNYPELFEKYLSRYKE